MVTGRTRPKKYALTSAHRALRPKILFEVLHIIIKKLVLFSKRRGLGHPQKQSPVLSVPEMYMEALLVKSLPIAEALKTGQKTIVKPQMKVTTDSCPDGTANNSIGAPMEHRYT